MMPKFLPVRLVFFASVYFVVNSGLLAQSRIVEIPAPNPAPIVAAPSPAPIAPAGPAPDQQQIARAQPRVSVFRDGSNIPQTPTRNGNQLTSVLVPTNESVLVQLEFDPALAGKSVRIAAASGLRLSRPDNTMSIGQRGEFVLQVAMLPDQSTGQMSIFVNDVGTVLHFTRASLSRLQKREMAAEGSAR